MERTFAFRAYYWNRIPFNWSGACLTCPFAMGRLACVWFDIGKFGGFRVDMACPFSL